MPNLVYVSSSVSPIAAGRKRIQYIRVRSQETRQCATNQPISRLANWLLEFLPVADTVRGFVQVLVVGGSRFGSTTAQRCVGLDGGLPSHNQHGNHQQPTPEESRRVKERESATYC